MTDPKPTLIGMTEILDTTPPATLDLTLNDEQAIALDQAVRLERRGIRQQQRDLRVRIMSEPDLDPAYADFMVKHLARQEEILGGLLTSLNRIIDRLI